MNALEICPRTIDLDATCLCGTPDAQHPQEGWLAGSQQFDRDRDAEHAEYMASRVEEPVSPWLNVLAENVQPGMRLGTGTNRTCLVTEVHRDKNGLVTHASIETPVRSRRTDWQMGLTPGRLMRVKRCPLSEHVAALEFLGAA